MNFYDNLKLHLNAGVKALYVESSEWMRFHSDIEEYCRSGKKSLFYWNNVQGLHGSNDVDDNTKDFVAALEGIIMRSSKDRSKQHVYVLELADIFLKNLEVASKFAITLRLLPPGNHIIVFAPTLQIPDSLNKEFAVIDFSLPERDDIRTLLLHTEKKFKIKADESPDILDSVRGLGTTEIRNAFAKIAVDHGKIGAEEIFLLVEEKEQIIRKSGFLTFIRPDEKGMDFIGGLENLREWLKKRKIAFGEKARDAGLDAPKGVLLLGIPGTGKSLCAKAAAHEWKIPLLRLDMGSIFSSGVGDSEANMRNVIKVAESLAPCVLWIDEIEKGLSGGASTSGELDGGTSVRVFGSLLTWMQEKSHEVFIFATANDISKLPPELLRKGRFDEIFFVDLPGREARKNIFLSHLIGKKQSDDPSIITKELLDDTKDFSGSEIESVVNEALFESYSPESQEQKAVVITTKSLRSAADNIIPLSHTMGENIDLMRQWAADRCRAANKDKPSDIESKVKWRLRGEAEPNLFIKKV